MPKYAPRSKVSVERHPAGKWGSNEYGREKGNKTRYRPSLRPPDGVVCFDSYALLGGFDLRLGRFGGEIIEIPRILPGGNSSEMRSSERNSEQNRGCDNDE